MSVARPAPNRLMGTAGSTSRGQLRRASYRHQADCRDPALTPWARSTIVSPAGPRTKCRLADIATLSLVPRRCLAHLPVFRTVTAMTTAKRVRSQIDTGSQTPLPGRDSGHRGVISGQSPAVFATDAPSLPPGAALAATAEQAATGLQVQELSALVRARDWRGLGGRVAGAPLSEPAVRMLATSRNREARRLVAWRRDLPDDLLERLCADRSAEVREAAEYTRWLRGPFSRMPAYPAEEVVHPECPVELLLLRATLGGPWARSRALAHPRLPESEWWRFAQAGDGTALRALGENPAMTLAQYATLCAELPPEAAAQLRVGYSGNANADVAELRAIVTGRARLTSAEVRALAGNPSAPADVLRAVWGPTTSPAELVRNPGCPADVLASMCAAHPNANWVHGHALVHSNADDSVRAAVRLPKLSRDAVLTALGRDCASATQVVAAARLSIDWNGPYPLLLAIAEGIAA